MQTIQLSNIFKQQAHQTILKDFTLTIPAQSNIGIQMSHVEAMTLFNLLRQTTPQTSGVMTGLTPARIQAIFHDDGFYPQLTVSTYLKTFQRISTFETDLDDILQYFALKDVAHTKIKHLSFDQQQRLALLRAFVLQPDLLLIESPLTNLTNAGIELYLAALAYTREHGVTVLLTSYSLEELVLTSTTIFRYRPNQGLELTDLATESSSDSAHTSEDTPRPIFKIASKVEDKTVFFSPNEIDFIESVNGVSQLNVSGEQFTSSQTMSELEQQLTTLGFFRCHRSYLVNLQQIAELISYSRNSYTLILKNKSKLPLSRGKLTDLKALINF